MFGESSRAPSSEQKKEVNYRLVDVVCGRVSEDDIKIKANAVKESLKLRNTVSFEKKRWPQATSLRGWWTYIFKFCHKQAWNFTPRARRRT